MIDEPDGSRTSESTVNDDDDDDDDDDGNNNEGIDGAFKMQCAEGYQPPNRKFKRWQFPNFNPIRQPPSHKFKIFWPSSNFCSFPNFGLKGVWLLNEFVFISPLLKEKMKRFWE